MLIIFSGPESIPRLAIARAIYAALLPDFEYAGYTISLKHYPFAIYKDGEPLYISSEGITKFLTDEPNAKILYNDIYDVVTELIGDKDNWRHIFVDLDWDVGIRFNTDKSTNAWEEQTKFGLTDRNPLDVLIENYQNRKHPVQVVVGSFSKHAIDVIRDMLGADNVTAINMLRHPQVDWVMSYQKDPQIVGNITKEDRDYIHNKEIINACLLTKHEDVPTLRFEEVIKAGHFEVNGSQVNLLTDYHSFNNWITIQEHEDFDMSLFDQAQYDLFQTQIEDTLSIIQGSAQDPRFQLLYDQSFRNLFTLTGYTPLTITQITSE